MNNIEGLTTETILYNIDRQKKWQESYRLTDKANPLIKTCQEIIDSLYKELKKRGVKCSN